MATRGQNLVVTKVNGEQIHADFIKLRQGVLTLRAVNHPIRKRMLELIESGKKLTVTEIYEKLRLEQSVASQHLAILRRSRLVNTKREGKFIYYSVNEEHIAEVNAMVNELVTLD